MLTDRPSGAAIVLAPSVAPSSLAMRSRRARIVIGVLFAGVAWASLPFLAGLMGAVVLAVLVTPLHRRLAPRIGPRRAALMLAVSVVLLLVTPAAFMLATMVQQVPTLLDSAVTSAAFSRLGTLRVGPIDVGAQIAEGGRHAVAWVSAHAMAATGSVTRAVLNLMLAVVGLYYLLPDGAALWKRARGWIPFSPRGIDEIGARFASITNAALLGIAATALSQGATIAIAFWLVGLPQPLFWGGVTGLVSILPILGSALVWAPAVVVLLLQDRSGAALALGGIGVVISSNVDNVVRPIIYRRVSGLHPMASLLGAFAGMELFGLLGLVLGPLALAYCIELLRLYESDFGAHPAPSSDRVDC